MLNRKLIRSNSFPCLALNQSIFPPASRSHINRLWSFVVWASHPPHPPNKDADKNAVDLSDKPGLLGHWSASLRAKKFVYNLLIQFYWKMVFKRLFSSKNQEEQWNGRWLTKHKELHRHQLLKNNLHNIVSFLSCFPWNLICAIHSALFRDMKENYFLHKSHKKSLWNASSRRNALDVLFIPYNKRVFFTLTVRNSWNTNLQNEVFFFCITPERVLRQKYQYRVERLCVFQQLQPIQIEQI